MAHSTKFGKIIIIIQEFYLKLFLQKLKCSDIIAAYLELLILKEQLQGQFY